MNPNDLERLQEALNRLAHEDSIYRYVMDFARASLEGEDCELRPEALKKLADRQAIRKYHALAGMALGRDRVQELWACPTTGDGAQSDQIAATIFLQHYYAWINNKGKVIPLRACNGGACGNVFLPNRKDKVYCSKSCSHSAFMERKLEKVQ